MATYKGVDIDLKPTEAMAEEAQRFLDWRKEGYQGGTDVAVARARQLVNRQELSADTVRRMHSFFSRHEVDKQAEGFSQGEDGYPSRGRLAWSAWGGDSGQSWARAKDARLDKIDEGERMLEEKRPYPNEHAARINDPDQYDRFRRDADAGGAGVDFIYGIADNVSEIQSIRFDAQRWSVDEAKAWLDEHDFEPILFEPAIEERAEQLKQEAIDSASEEVGFFGRMAGNESKSDLEARPITDFMSPAERLAYNQAQKDLAAIDAQLGRESSQASGGTDDQALQDLEGPATERDLSGLPTISPIARSASDSIAISEGYSPDLQINVPDTINSGVTIAGLDIGGLNPEGDSVKMDILERYLSPEDFSALKQLVGLKGSEAQKKLEEFQSQGLLQQDGLGLTEQDIIDIPALYVSAVELPRIYKIIPEEEFASLPSEIRNVVLDVQFNVHGPRTLKKIREAIKSGDKASWMEVANAYYNPETGATYFGSKEQTQQKIDSGNIGRGNVKRVKAARENLLAWIEKTYG